MYFQHGSSYVPFGDRVPHTHTHTHTHTETCTKYYLAQVYMKLSLNVSVCFGATNSFVLRNRYASKAFVQHSSYSDHCVTSNPQIYEETVERYTFTNCYSRQAILLVRQFIFQEISSQEEVAHCVYVCMHAYT